MLRKKKTQRRLPRPLYRGNARQRGVLSKTLWKKKKEETQGTTRKNNQKTCTRSFSTGEKNTVGQKERYVLRITHATHFCYASTGPPLLLFEPCRRPTTRTNQGMTRPTNHTLQAHTRTRTAATPRTTPPTAPTPTRRATQHTQTHQDQGEGHPGPPAPQPVDPSQEWRGTTPTANGQERQGAGAPNRRPPAHHTHATTHTSTRGRNTHRTTTQHHQQRRHHKHATHNTAQPPRTPTHTTNTHNKGHPNPRNTPPQPAGPSQEWRGAAHPRRQRNPARSGGE